MNKLFNIKNLSKKQGLIALSPLTFIVLSACGGSSGGGVSSSYNGFVIKGPLSNAKVFADYDNDGILDSDEPFAVTNQDGSYTLNASSDFSAIVVTTDSNTIDTSSGAVLAGVTLKAPKAAGVVSPTSTMVYESDLSVSEVAKVLGLPEDFDLDFNPFAEGVDQEKAAAVEKTSQMIMTTINAISGSAEGVGLSSIDAFKTAVEAIVEVVKEKVSTNLTVDLSNDSVLEEVQTKAVTAAVKRGADEANFISAVDQAVQTTKSVNQNIKNLENIFSDEAKDVLKTVSQVKQGAQNSAEQVVAVNTPQAEEVTRNISINSVAEDDIININELSVSGFKITGKALSEATVLVEFGSIKKTATASETGNWEVTISASDLSSAGIDQSSLPEKVSAILNPDSSKEETTSKQVTGSFTQPKATINAIGGDGVVNVAERDGKLAISGTSDAGTDGTIKIKLLDARDSSNITELTNYTSDINSDLTSNPIKISESGSWSYSLPATSNFPPGNFKIQVIPVDASGNEGNAVTSSTIPTDFDAPTVSLTNATANTTVSSNVTYTVNFDQAVNYFTTSSVNVTGGSVSSLTGNGKTYTLVVSPNSDSEGNITISIPEGGAKDSSSNSNEAFTNSDQKFDTKAPSVTTVTKIDGNGVVNGKVTGSMKFQADFSENGITNFDAADINFSSIQGNPSVSSTSDGTDSNGNPFDRFLVNYTPKDGIDANVTLTISGFNDTVNNAGVQSVTTFAVDTKGPTGQLNLPTGTFSLGQVLNFGMTYDETVAVSGGESISNIGYWWKNENGSNGQPF